MKAQLLLLLFAGSAVACSSSSEDAPNFVPDDAATLDAGAESEAAPSPVGDGVPPTLLGSSPAMNETVSAKLLFDAFGRPARRSITAAFSEPMDVGVSAIDIASGEDVRTLPVLWNSDGTAFEADVPALPDGAGAQLRYNVAYRVDLRKLRDRSGMPLDPSAAPLVDGALRFRTLSQEPLLEHTCGHTIEEPFATFALGGTTESAPTVGLLHKRYLIAFPGGSNEGVARLDVLRSGALSAFAYSLFVNWSVRITAVRIHDGAPIDAVSREVPPVCAKLTNVTRIGMFEGDSYELSFVGDGKHDTFELYFERESL